MAVKYDPGLLGCLKPGFKCLPQPAVIFYDQ